MRKKIIFFIFLFSISLLNEARTINSTEIDIESGYTIVNVYLNNAQVGDIFSVPINDGVCGYSASFERIGNTSSFRVVEAFYAGDVCTYRNGEQIVYRIYANRP